MINGFTIDIENLSGNTLTVPLFRDHELSSGLIIKAIGTNLNYDSLNLMSRDKGFRGIGILSTFQTICTISFTNESIHISPGVMYDGLEINIDGFSKYIIITIPPHTKGVFQLLHS